MTPPLDALEEFKVLRSNYSAEFGGGTGGVVNVVTKQGTQQFHGTAYEYFRNDKLDANDFFLNQQGQRAMSFASTISATPWVARSGFQASTIGARTKTSFSPPMRAAVMSAATLRKTMYPMPQSVAATSQR